MAFPAFAVGQTASPYSGGAFNPNEEEKTFRTAENYAEGVAYQNDKAQESLNATVGAVGSQMSDFMRRLNEQEALTFRQDVRNKMLVAGQKAVNDWEPSAYGANALASPKSLNEKLLGIKEQLLASAPSDLAKTHAGQELDNQIAQYGVHAENVATKGFKKWGRDVQTVNEEQLLQVMANGGADPAIHQWVIDTGKASYQGLGTAGVIYSKDEAAIASQEFEKKAALVAFQSQLANPKFTQKAIADFQSGFYADKLDAEQLIKAQNMVEAKKDHLRAEAERFEARASRERAKRTEEILLEQQDAEKNGTLDDFRAKWVDSGKLREMKAAGLLEAHNVRVIEGVQSKDEKIAQAERFNDLRLQIAMGANWDQDTLQGKLDEAKLRPEMQRVILNESTSKILQSDGYKNITKSVVDELAEKGDSPEEKAKRDLLAANVELQMRDLVVGKGLKPQDARDELLWEWREKNAKPAPILGKLGVYDYPDNPQDINLRTLFEKALQLRKDGQLTKDELATLIGSTDGTAVTGAISRFTDAAYTRSRLGSKIIEQQKTRSLLEQNKKRFEGGE